ncbi:MAG: transcription elongation factor GreA [Chloroflexota bacterium]|nr:MAG: transcription elongation factor GreA [Chloroflexota bacterium]
MPDKPVFLTPEGRDKLQQELDNLINVKRPEVAEAIHSAKEEGDISENSAYDAAKEQQAFVEGRIMQIEQMLKNAEIIDSRVATGLVVLGSRVKVVEKGTKDEEEYQIVGSAEADPNKGRISNESPIGRALMGKKKGDSIAVKTPAGELHFRLIEVW